MSLNKNKQLKVPSFKKSISDFLKNESGSVTTKSALAVGALGVASVALSDIAGATCDINGGHFNGSTNGHYSGAGTFGATVKNIPNESCNYPSNMNDYWNSIFSNDGKYSNYDNGRLKTFYYYDKGCTTLKCIPINGLVNGHYNITPSCSSSLITKHCNHVSSGDSGDSGDGGDSCG